MNEKHRRGNSIMTSGDPDERVYGDVKVVGRSPNTTVTKIFRRGDVMHLVSGAAVGNRVNFYSSLDSTIPAGQVSDLDLVAIHLPKLPGAKNQWFLPK